MIEFKFEKSNAFCREVMAHFIAKNNPESIKNIDEEVDKCFDWFDSPKSGNFNGDVFTTARYLLLTNFFFIDKGCNKETVGECMKEFCKAFGGCSDEIYKEYEEIEDFFEDFCFCGVSFGYLTIYDYDSFGFLCNEICNEIFIKLQMFSNEDVRIDESHAIRALDLFDEKFEWLAPYGFHSNWKVIFCAMVSVLQNIITTLEQTKMNFVADPSATEYQTKAQAFLDKYLKFEQ